MNFLIINNQRNNNKANILGNGNSGKAVILNKTVKNQGKS